MKEQTEHRAFNQSEKEAKTIEVRGFLQLDARLRKITGKLPLILPLAQPTTGRALAQQLGIEPREVEIIFVNGFVEELDHEIRPGDRMAFLPPGCPGPYRIALGFYGKNQNNPANFKLENRE